MYAVCGEQEKAQAKRKDASPDQNLNHKEAQKDQDDNEGRSTISNSRTKDTAPTRKRQKVQPFKFLPPDSFGKNTVLERSRPQELKNFTKPAMALSGSRDLAQPPAIK